MRAQKVSWSFKFNISQVLEASVLLFQSALFLWPSKKAGKFFVVSTLDVTKNKLLNIGETKKRKRKKRGVFVGGEKQEDKRDDDQ